MRAHYHYFSNIHLKTLSAEYTYFNTHHMLKHFTQTSQQSTPHAVHGPSVQPLFGTPKAAKSSQAKLLTCTHIYVISF